MKIYIYITKILPAHVHCSEKIVNRYFLFLFIYLLCVIEHWRTDDFTFLHKLFKCVQTLFNSSRREKIASLIEC